MIATIQITPTTGGIIAGLIMLAVLLTRVLWRVIDTFITRKVPALGTTTDASIAETLKELARMRLKDQELLERLYKRHGQLRELAMEMDKDRALAIGKVNDLHDWHAPNEHGEQTWKGHAIEKALTDLTREIREATRASTEALGENTTTVATSITSLVNELRIDRKERNGH